MFERYGLIEARDFDEMLDLAAGFLACKDRLPKGNRVGICTASGGAGIWMADACAAAGLDVPVLDDETRATLSVNVPVYGTSQNPVDFTAQGVQKLGYAEFARVVARSPTIDSVVVVITARRSAFLEADLPKFKELARTTDKPVLMWSYTLPSERTVEILNDIGFPLFMSAPGCARTLRKMVDYRARCAHPEMAIDPPIRAAMREKAAAALAKSPAIICEYRARAMLEPYGIGSKNAGRLVQSADEAVAAAREMGWPVALKVQSADIPHKTEAGAVILHLEGPDKVRAGFDAALAAAKNFAPAAHIDGVLVQRMVPPGREVILGISHDATFGPLLLVGLGGVLAEALGDVAVAPVPLDQGQARALIGRLKAANIFGRYRGFPPADIDALSLLMVRLSQFAHDHAEEILAIDLNPVIVHSAGDGVSVVDALITKRVGSGAISPRARNGRESSGSMTTFKDIGVEKSGHVALVEIRRPPNNFFDAALISEIATAFEALDADAECRALVLAAQGKAFCAGANFGDGDRDGSEILGGPRPGAAHLYIEGTRLFRTKKPIVAAVHGAAVGGGLGLAMVADFRVTCPEARFSANFTRLGFHPGFGLTVTLPAVIGPTKAALLFYTSRRIGGEEALKLGLADVLAPQDKVREAALSFAAEIAENSPLGLIATRATLRGDLADRVRAATERELAEQTRLRQTEDFKEGVKAMAERRPPNFNNR